MSLFQPLHEISLEDIATFGGKAARLGNAMRLGCPVLPGVVLSTELFRRFMQQGGLQGEISSILSTMQPQTMSQFQAAEWAIKSAFDVRRVPNSIVRTIGEAWESLGADRVAVRSSATNEDSPKQSFVGQHAVFLNVDSIEGAVEAVLGCWSSLYSAQALSYARSFGVDLVNASMAVLLQPMVEPTAEGVLFTVDPVTGNPDAFVLEVQQGDETGVYELDPYERPPGEEATWSRLRHVGLMLDEHELVYQTLEWFLVDDEVVLLRVRPVTGVPRYLPQSASDVGAGPSPLEWLHDPAHSPRSAKPFSWYHRSRSRQLNAAYYRRIKSLFSEFTGRIEYYPCGYLYAEWQQPRTSMFDQVDPVHQFIQDMRRFARARTLDREYLQLREEKRPRLDQLNEQELSQIDLGELAEYLEEVMSLHESFWEQCGYLASAAQTLRQVLERQLGDWLLDDTVDMDALLWTQHSARAQALERLGDLAQRDYDSLEENQRAFDLFFRQNRHFFIPGDSLAPWRDITSLDPDSDLVFMEWEAGQRSEHSDKADAELDESRRLIEQVIGKKLGGLKRWTARRLVEMARHYGTLSQECEDPVLLCRVLERQVIQEVGRRLKAQGLCASETDAALLGCREIIQWLRHELPEDEIVRAMTRRKDQAQHWWRYSPPAELATEEETAHPFEDQDGERFNGRPICAGWVNGRARVIKSSSEAANVLPGEILVCQELLFELSPLFTIVSAVVAEKGALLDHASVLAREYGVPTVFGVAEATTHINTGDELAVDATHGVIIRRLPEPEWDTWSNV